MKSSHPHTQDKKDRGPQVAKRQSGITQILFDTETPKKVLALEPTQEVEVSQTSDPRQRNLTAKFGRQIKYMPIESYCIGEKMSLMEKDLYPNQTFGKAHCLMVVHSGINKNLSNEAIFENYDVSMKGMESQYLFNLECFKNEAVQPEVKRLLMPPIRMALNPSTIYNCVQTITAGHRSSPSSAFQKVQKSPFWGFIHDSIIKFGMDFLGIFIKGVDSDTIRPVSTPLCLEHIKRGHTGVDLANYLVSAIASHLKVKDSAFNTISSEVTALEGAAMEPPPEFFKLGTVKSVNQADKEIHIQLSDMPVANNGDGVATNGKAARLLSVCYVLDSPSVHCAAHGSDLVMKRMATSKTMSVSEVVAAYEALRPVIKHFELSTKNKEKLDASISMLHLQQIHLISWSGTRMTHFVTACRQFACCV